MNCVTSVFVLDIHVLNLGKWLATHLKPGTLFITTCTVNGIYFTSEKCEIPYSNKCTVCLTFQNNLKFKKISF